MSNAFDEKIQKALFEEIVGDEGTVVIEKFY